MDNDELGSHSRHERYDAPPRRPTLLVILDGVGLNPNKANNAIHLASTPNLDRYLSRHPHTALAASGAAVGLPPGQMGNSEVGHMSIGSGAIQLQDLVRIDRAIADGSLASLPALRETLDEARRHGGRLHLLGLASDGGVHGHMAHLEALVEIATEAGIEPVLHLITDGRDASPASADRFVARMEALLRRRGGYVATVTGRFYAMDRDRRWARTEAAWRALALGEGERAGTALEAVTRSHTAGVLDEFIHPTVIDPRGRIAPGEVVLFANFRNDRSRQLAEALADPGFGEFERGAWTPARLTTMTRYSGHLPARVLFPPLRLETCLGAVVAEAGLRQFHCAETEKFAHVTFFFNGGREEPFPGEERILIPSPKVETYDQAPAMSAAQVTDATIAALQSGQYAFAVVNYANGDMVGHSGVRAAIIEAVEVLDRELGRLVDAAEAAGYSVVITADHGNCDEMVDPQTGEPQTQHTTHPVPFIVIDPQPLQLMGGGALDSVAPTVLTLMGLPVPSAMSGRSLIVFGGEEQAA